MFSNEPFITVIQTFFTPDGSFVCSNTDRQGTKTVIPPGRKKNSFCLAGGSLLPTLLKSSHIVVFSLAEEQVCPQTAVQFNQHN